MQPRRCPEAGTPPHGAAHGTRLADAKAKGVKFGRKPKLTTHQRREAQKRLRAGETQRSIARTFNVSQATMSRLSADEAPPPKSGVRRGQETAQPDKYSRGLGRPEAAIKKRTPAMLLLHGAREDFR